MSGFLAFARAPLIWSAVILALYTPFAFIDAIVQPPPADCTDWLWCDSRYVGMVFDPTPDPSNLVALLIIPGALIAYFAARVAARGPNRHAHWFMAPFVATLFALSVYFYLWPFELFISASTSHRPTVIVQSQHLALILAIAASVPLALIELAGACAWRVIKRNRPITAATS